MESADAVVPGDVVSVEVRGVADISAWVSDGLCGEGVCDAVIDDGTVVDVKSMTTFGMKDMLGGVFKWGYKEQLDSYAVGLGISKFTNFFIYKTSGPKKNYS